MALRTVGPLAAPALQSPAPAADCAHRLLHLEDDAILPGDHRQQVEGVGIGPAQTVQRQREAATVALAQRVGQVEIMASLASLTNSITSSLWIGRSPA